MSPAPLLAVEDLAVSFETDDGIVDAVSGVSFEVAPGETLALVGESGSGKSVTARSVTRLHDEDRTTIEGTVLWQGEDVYDYNTKTLRSLRGAGIAHVFQDASSALHPMYTVGTQLRRIIRRHSDRSKEAARAHAVDLLERVGIPRARVRIDDHPHEFSGGMQQRIHLAMALAGDPALLIADEPTTGLDVTIQAQVLELLADLQRSAGLSILLITHDLGVVAELADRVAVMYAGQIQERGSVEACFDNPAHPYTRGLFGSLPGRGLASTGIPGTHPEPTDQPEGCRFHPRCPFAIDRCRSGDQPEAVVIGPAEKPRHRAACVHHHEGADPGAIDGDERFPATPLDELEPTEGEDQ